MRKYIPIILLILLISTTCSGQEKVIKLWPEQIPNHRETDETETQVKGNILKIKNVQEPTLEIYLPTKQSATGKAMVICPGGGYGNLAYDWEGTDIAKSLNAKGIAAFVLKYRLPGSKSVITGHKAPLQDAKRAIRLVRLNAEKWNVSKDQIGVLGFSAGGHLASTLSTHYNQDEYSEPESLDSISARPDFMALIYPVITMNSSHTHLGSRKNLLGDKPDQQLVDYYSNELHIDDRTPPTFIVHATDDKVVPVMHSLLFYQALEKEGVYTEMHIYPKGGHGFSLANGRGHLQNWPDQLFDWMKSLK